MQAMDIAHGAGVKVIGFTPPEQPKKYPAQRSCRGVGAQHAAPLRALSGYTTRIVNPTLPARPPLPGLRLPLGRRRLGPGATLAVFVHAVIVGVLVIGGGEIVGGGEGGARAGGGGGGGDFFAIP